MATWADVRSFLASNYNIHTDNGDNIQLLFELEGMRSQFVQVWSMPYDMLWVISPVGPVNEVDGNKLLALTSSVDVSAGVRVIGDLVVTIHAMPMADLSIDELVEPMNRMMVCADALENALGLGDRY